MFLMLQMYGLGFRASTFSDLRNWDRSLSSHFSVVVGPFAATTLAIQTRAVLDSVVILTVVVITNFIAGIVRNRHPLMHSQCDKYRERHQYLLRFLEAE